MSKEGNKTVEVRLHFFTDQIAANGGVFKAKHAVSVGTARLPTNPRHGITKGECHYFESLAELPATVAKALAAHGITLHPGKKQSRAA